MPVGQNTNIETAGRVTASQAEFRGVTTSYLKVTNSVLQLPVATPNSETVVVLDPSGDTANSYLTLQNAVNALAAQSGDIGVIELAADETIALTADIDFSVAQQRFRRVIVRGLGRTVALDSDPVASTTTFTPGHASGNSWLWPVMTATLTASALTDHVLLNETNGAYFAVRDNTTSTVEAMAPPASFETATQGQMSRHHYGVDASAVAFSVADVLTAFVPTSEITCALDVTLTQLDSGRDVEFEEIAFAGTTACNIHSPGRLVFRGCLIDFAALSLTNVGPISANVRVEGCVSTTGGDGRFGNDNETQTRELLRSVFRGGHLGAGTGYEMSPPRLIVSGCYCFDAFLNNNVNSVITQFIVSVDTSVFEDSAVRFTGLGSGTVVMNSCTVSGDSMEFGLANNGILEYCVLSYPASNALLILSLSRVAMRNCTIEGRTALFENSALRVVSSTFDTTASQNGAVAITVDDSHLSSESPGFTLSGIATQNAILLRRQGLATINIDASSAGFTDGIFVQSGSRVVAIGTPPAGLATNNAKVGDNAIVSFATLATGLAADVNDYATASPQMCSFIVTV